MICLYFPFHFSFKERSSHPAPSTIRRARWGEKATFIPHNYGFLVSKFVSYNISLISSIHIPIQRRFFLLIYIAMARFHPTRLAHRSNLGQRARTISLGRAGSKSGYLEPTEGFSPKLWAEGTRAPALSCKSGCASSFSSFQPRAAPAALSPHASRLD